MTAKTILISMYLFMLLFSFGGAGETLEQGFGEPPLEARTRCYWWWLNGNVTREALTRDLEEMQAKGFGGALLFDADSSSHKTVTPVPTGPMYGTEAWRLLFKHAVEEAARLGLELGLNIQSGWNLGGPCVSEEEAAKQVTWSEITVTGPRPEGSMVTEPASRAGYYRDIAVLAYKKRLKPAVAGKPDPAASSTLAGYAAVAAVDADIDTYWVSDGTNPGDGPSTDTPAWLQLDFGNPVTVGGIQVTGRPGYGPRSARLDVSSGNNGWKTVKKLTLDRDMTATVYFRPVTAKQFRLVLTAAYDPRFPDAPRNVQVAEWLLLDPDQEPLEGMRYGPPISHLDLKTGFHELGGSAPDCRFLLDDVAGMPDEEDARAVDILDLTDTCDGDGNLHWSIPAGTWTILRFGYTLTGAKVSTSSGDWQGSVLDYMSTPVLEAYWDRNVRPLLSDVEPFMGETLRFLHTDSWECGGMNWTPGFQEEFRTRRGYDLIPFLPVVAGKIIKSRDASNRFLADFRKTIAECVAENHYAPFAAIAHAAGLEVHPESGGPHAGPLDGIRNLGLSDMPMGEFWVPSPHRPAPENRFFVKQAASAAHIYGKRRVAAEAFTSIGPHWEDVLWRSVKPSFDHEACAGLNLSFIHTFTCSPKEMGLPGQEYFAGTHFNPNVTWWDLGATPVIQYLNRCHFLLQQGRFVADVCYYYGDHVPNIAARKEADPAGVLPAYDYDVLSEDILVSHLMCKNTELVLPSGMRYRLLVLPDHGILSLDALQKVDILVRAGAVMLGAKPARTASLTGGPEAETRFHALADGLWGAPEVKRGHRRVDAGQIFWGMTGREVLKRMGVVEDCAWEGPEEAFGYIHRQMDDGDIYFISSRSEEPACSQFTFRVRGKQPEVWDPLTGEIRDAPCYVVGEDTVTMPLEFAPFGALFIVFRKAARLPQNTGNFPVYAPVLALEGPWEVSFDPRWGGPESVVFPVLQSWTARPEEGIRYYSGTATYRTSFHVPEGRCDTETGLALDLGIVHEIASVRLNGKALGVLWTPPFRVRTGNTLVPGDNILEIEVVNNWPNRLIGDVSLPEGKRLTRTNVTKFSSKMPLAPSGLLGPVQILYIKQPLPRES